MIVGVGLDTTILSRFNNLLINDRFLNRILTKQEMEDFFATSDSKKVNFLAKRFSGKEAFAKALGFGVGGFFSFKSIEILKTSYNAPFIRIIDEKIAEKITSSLISFSDEKLPSSLGEEVLISSVVILQK
jgi:holo-[acyl-carrier protein] synthase